MQKFLISLFLLSFFSSLSYSQTNHRLWGGLEVGYGLSLSDRGDNYKVSYDGDTKMTISSLRGVVGYYVIPQLSVGVGIGFNSYTKPGLNTIPVCLDLRYHPLENKKFSINGNIGYTIATSENYFNGKFMSDISVGYKLLNLGKLSLIPSFGYNFINYSVENKKKLNQSRHSLFLKIGLIY